VAVTVSMASIRNNATMLPKTPLLGLRILHPTWLRAANPIPT
jgi:hypothetical protein